VCCDNVVLYEYEPLLPNKDKSRILLVFQTYFANSPEFVSIFCCFICKQRLIAVVTECGVVCDWIYSSGAHVVDKVSCNKLLPVSISIV